MRANPIISFLIKISIVLLLAFSSINIKAQCNFNPFTLTPNNGVCTQDASIDVAITGATSCTAGLITAATLKEVGDPTVLDFITLSNTGTGSFLNLPPGNYEVFLTQNGKPFMKV